jgi:hypothetical protein
MLEKKTRKVTSHGAVTTIGLTAGQIVTVVRIDERTELVSVEPPDRVEAMASLLVQDPKTSRHGELAARLQGRTHQADPLPRKSGPVEPDTPLTETDARRFTHPARPRRPF